MFAFELIIDLNTIFQIGWAIYHRSSLLLFNLAANNNGSFYMI